ncbi:caspase family protein [Streptomyces sp. NPDC021096]|uniref:caspase family protein n=1 Tax=Streptomyces sp. NPDC021096 TaxID=3154792 RepID=UPI00340E2E5E
MGTVYALLVGINDYARPSLPPLAGCLNDIAAARGWLRERLGTPPAIKELTDGGATAGAVADAITWHLGQAGPGDTALFWFSGHGTEYAVNRPEDLLIEATGRCQAIVCADEALPDKRLGALLDAVAARGAHVAAVLDCCFSGGGTREPGAAARYAPPLAEWSAAVKDAAGPSHPPRHVLLAGSRLDQVAYERDFDDRRHGIFTRALLDALRAAPPTATYREVLAGAHGRVQSEREHQHPVLFPAEPGGVADTPVLGGLVRAPAPHLLRHGREGWEVDCGSVHGLRGGEGPALATEFTVTDDTDPAPPSPLVRARSVRAERTLVDPGAWEPDPARTYAVALSSLALPPVSVRLEGPDAPLVTEALATAGPRGRPSPLLGPGGEHGMLLRVAAGAGRARVMRRDGSAAVPDLPLTGPDDARRVARCLVHLARWHQLRDLDNPGSPLAGQVRVEIAPWTPYGDASPLTPDGHGEIVCHYTGRPGAWRRPEVSIRIRNRSRRPLWAVLLDLTDSHGCDTALYEGHFIGPGGTGHAFDGEQPVELSLPASRDEVPGAFVRDWLKLIVAEGELNTVPFRLPAWDPAAGFRAADHGPAADGVLHLAAPGTAGHRDAVASRRTAPGQWAVLTVPVRTVIPPLSGPGA